MSSARRSTLTALAVIDKYTRECLAIEVGRTGRDRGLFVVRGTARHLRSDHRPEFVAKAVRSSPTFVGAVLGVRDHGCAGLAASVPLKGIAPAAVGHAR